MTILILDRAKLNRIICAHTTAYSMSVFQNMSDSMWWNEICQPKELARIRVILSKKFESFVKASVKWSAFYIKVELSDRNEALLFKLTY